ncbi:MAG TPA: hypothetical protein VGJ33_10380 [Candidatus Angelobacter sp.]
MFFLGARDPVQAETVMLRIPFVSAAMFQKTQQSFHSDGAWALTKGREMASL